MLAEFIQDIQLNNVNTASNVKCRLTYFNTFLKTIGLDIETIVEDVKNGVEIYTLFNKFKAYLVNLHTISNNTINTIITWNIMALIFRDLINGLKN